MLNKFFLLSVVLYLGTGSSVLGQYALGLRSGPILWDASGNAAQRAIVDKPLAYSVGLILQQVNEEGNGFRFGLERLARYFNLDLFNGATNRREVFQMHSVFLQFSSEIRYHIGGSGRTYFDTGPVFSALILERRSGVAYYDYPGQEDPQYYSGQEERGFEINDIRWRMGLSRDIPLSDQLFLTVHASGSPGWSGWFRGRGFLTMDLQLAVGLVHVIGRTAPKAPEELPDPIGYYSFPRNSRLTELMQ